MSRRATLRGDLEEILGRVSPARQWESYEETVGAPLVVGARPYAVPGGASLLSRKPTKSRQLSLPLSSNGTVAATTQTTVQNQPQVVFRPERLIISDPSAYFTVQDLKVGKDSQFIAPGSQPSAVWAPGSFGVRLKMDTCQVSMIIAITVTNTDSAAHAFLASVIGPAVM